MSQYTQNNGLDGIKIDFTNILNFFSGNRYKWLLLAAALVSSLVILSILRGLYTDLVWFGELSYSSVYMKILTTKIVLFIIGFSIFAVVCGASLYIAFRWSTGEYVVAVPLQIKNFLSKAFIIASLGIIILLGLLFGSSFASKWELFLKAANSVSFQTSDPVFNKDISFYIYSLPVYDFINSWALTVAIVVTIATGAMYFLNYSARGVGIKFSGNFLVHLSIIASIIMLIIGLGHWIDRWALVLSESGLYYGATYTDINARKPGLAILTFISFASAILMIANIYKKDLKIIIAGFALWIIALLFLTIAWPNAMQRFTVNPNEFGKEEISLNNNIEFTRQAYGLSEPNLMRQSYPVNPEISSDIIEQNIKTLDNIRLWDDDPLSDVYRQIQLIRPYYGFKDADVDRYTINNDYRQVMLAAREVDQSKLEPQAQTWINKKLIYTHGFGFAMSPVTEFTAEGRPEFFAKDLPNDGLIRIASSETQDEPDKIVSNPRIYYGEITDDYVIVNSNTKELDYIGADGIINEFNYDGNGGVGIGSFIRKLAYAWQFGDLNILISNQINENSRLQYRRDIQSRILAIAPFLKLDQDPYLVAREEGLVWMQDAYTTSDKYPYSDLTVTEDGTFNYLRNSVKIVVDAYNGEVDFFAVDNSDPLIRTYRSIFPDLFDRVDLPEDIAQHVRYPQDLFQFQSDKYLRYHMESPRDFYNLEDVWNVPEEKFGQEGDLQTVKPYYVIMKIPGENREEFVLLLPFTRNDPPIMAGWLAARNDGVNYGSLIAFTFPKGRQIDSPEQIEAKIDNDPTISEWFTLRCQEGSECIRGNLLVIPVAAVDSVTGEQIFSLIYAEPIYLKAEGVEFPELKTVILATQEKVVMGTSIKESIYALSGYELDEKVDDESNVGEVESTDGTVLDSLIDSLESFIIDLEEKIDELKSIKGGNE